MTGRDGTVSALALCGLMCVAGCASTLETTHHPSAVASPDATPVSEGLRARDLGVPFDGETGPWNAITDVQGVQVGHVTLIEGEGATAVRTGVTAILQDERVRPVFAATYRLNGDGEMTGGHFIDEKGYLISPVLLTGTASVGTVHEAVLRWSLESARADRPIHLAVVAETWDGDLNDLYGLHVRAEHVARALDGARTGPVAEGNVGGGTGMWAHDFKAGIGTSSRVLSEEQGGYTLGVLVQANYGDRAELRIAGVPVGRQITDLMPELNEAQEGDGSIVVVVATDAPLLPHQLKRIARRIPMGLARCGSFASTWSGDLFLAFSTAAIEEREGDPLLHARYLQDADIDPLFLATVRATEEAVVNALVAAETMTGVNGNRVHALPHQRLQEVLRRYGRWSSP